MTGIKEKFKKGSILLETLLALALGSTLITAVAQSLIGGQQANLKSYQNQQAEFYLKEAQEALKSVWYSGWNNIAENGIYHPQVNSGSWTLVEGEENKGIYIRKINLDDVLRNSSGDIVVSGGVLDPSTKKATVTVDWDSPRPMSIKRTFYLTRYLNNTSWVEDSLEEFEDGIEDATDATINPGYVQLAQTGGGGWEEPGSISTVDCFGKTSGGWVTESLLFITLDIPTGGVEVFDLEDPGPASPSSLGVFDTEQKGLDIAINGSVAYITHGNLNPSVSVYDISSDPVNPTFVGWANIAQASQGIWLTPTNIFVTVQNSNQVAVYEKTADPLNPDFLGIFETVDTAVDIAVSGNYAYVALNSNENAVEIFDISEESENPTSVASFSNLYLPTGIWIESNTLYLSLDQKRSAMYTLEYNPLSPILLGIFQVERNTADVAAYGDYGYVFGLDSQLKAIEVIYIGDSKGASGIYFVYGEYTSSVFDPGSQVAFNRISWEGEELVHTNILFQYALNNDNSTWNFIGPDGTSASYFEEPGALPLTDILGSYFKYKIILTGNGAVTPVVDKVMINYSP